MSGAGGLARKLEPKAAVLRPTVIPGALERIEHRRAQAGDIAIVARYQRQAIGQRGPRACTFNTLSDLAKDKRAEKRSSSATDSYQAETYASQRVPFRTSEMMLVSIR